MTGTDRTVAWISRPSGTVSSTASGASGVSWCRPAARASSSARSCCAASRTGRPAAPRTTTRRPPRGAARPARARGRRAGAPRPPPAAGPAGPGGTAGTAPRSRAAGRRRRSGSAWSARTRTPYAAPSGMLTATAISSQLISTSPYGLLRGDGHGRREDLPARAGRGVSGCSRRKPCAVLRHPRRRPLRGRPAGRAAARPRPAPDRGSGVGGRRGRVQLDRGQAEPPVQRPGGHVDELHPAVGHHDELPEQDTAGDEQVVGPLGVPPGAHRPADHHPAPADGDQAEHDDDHHQPARDEPGTGSRGCHQQQADDDR